MNKKTSKQFQVYALALPSCLGSSLALPLEMLNAANNLLTAKRSPQTMSMELIGLQKGSLKLAGGLTLTNQHTIDDIDQADLILLPSAWRFSPQRNQPDQRLISWLQRMYQQKSEIVSVGTGSYILAHAGLLDGQAATTHWSYLDDFVSRFPKANTHHKHLITAANGVYCAGSVNSVADLIIHLLEVHWGKDIARLVEQQFSPEIRQPYANTAFQDPFEAPHADETVVDIQTYLNTNFEQSHSIKALSEKFKLSSRTLQRRFQKATGLTIFQYIQNKRFNEAKQLLSKSDLSIAAIAQTIGFSDSAYFCRQFKQHQKQSPGEYRRSVRGKLFSL